MDVWATLATVFAALCVSLCGTKGAISFEESHVSFLLNVITQNERLKGQESKIDSPHDLQERQSCGPNSDEQRRRVAVARCDADYISAVANFGLVTCHNPFISSTIQDIMRCGSDRGTLCALHEPSLASGEDILDRFRDAEEQCFEVNSLADTLANCSNECRAALKVIADDYGCCVHSETDITRGSLARVLTPLLWSQCGVSRPEPCDDAPFTLLTTQQQSCSFLCTYSKYVALECKQIGNKLLDIYEECGDVESANEIRQQCGFNEMGQSCGASLELLLELNNLFSVYDTCYRYMSAGVCTRECGDALKGLKNRFGCCLNTANRTTSDGFRTEEIEGFLTDPALWSACAVDTPPFCSVPADGSVYDKFINCDTCLESL